jgi:hypothetical protein
MGRGLGGDMLREDIEKRILKRSMVIKALADLEELLKKRPNCVSDFDIRVVKEVVIMSRNIEPPFI